MDHNVEYAIEDYQGETETTIKFLEAYIAQSYGEPKMSDEDVKAAICSIMLHIKKEKVFLDRLLEIARFQPPKKSLIKRLLRK